MTLEQAAKVFKKFSRKDLLQMEKDKLLIFPLDNMAIGHLAFLHKLWGNKHWLKRQMARLPRKDRLKIVDTAGLSKLESYVMSRCLNAERGKRLPVEQLVDEVCHYFRQKPTGELWKKVKTIKRKATLIRKKRGKEQTREE